MYWPSWRVTDGRTARRRSARLRSRRTSSRGFRSYVRSPPSTRSNPQVVAYHGGTVKEKRKWSNIHCDDFTLTPDDDTLVRRSRDVSRCRRCKRRVRGMATTVIVSAFTTLGTIRFSLKRATPESDARFWKFLGIAVGCISFGTAIGPLLSFREHCTRSTTEGIHMRNGPGFICLSIAVCLKGLSVLMHLWLRVPDIDDDAGTDEEGPEESKDGGGEESK